MSSDPRRELRESIRNLNMMLSGATGPEGTDQTAYRRAALDVTRAGARLNKALATENDVHNALNHFEHHYHGFANLEIGADDFSIHARVAQKERQTINKRIEAVRKHYEGK